MTGVIGWGSRDWIGEEVEGWIGEVVGQRCRLVHRETRPWSTLWTVSTGAETLWFKANCPAQPSEAGVHAALARLVPDYVDAPVAVEPARGWLLTREGGTPLNHCSPNGTGDVGLATLTAVVRDYAALQRGTVGCGDQLVSAGLRVAHPVDAAELAASQAEQLAMLRAGDPRRLTADERDSVLASLPALEKAGRVLTGGAVPLAFDQSDLFPRNVFSRRLGGPYRFFDFADAVWAHPFGSLLMLVAGCLRWWRISATVGAERPYLGLSTRTVARAVRVVGTVGSVGDARRRVAETRRRLYLHGPQWTRGEGDFGRISLPRRDGDVLRDLLVAERATTVVEIGSRTAPRPWRSGRH